MIFLRYILVGVAIFLLVRALTNHSETEEPTVRKAEQDKNSKASNKKVSKKIGEYIDYEEVKKESR
jgi:large-conductance mechanosensitive channel